MNRLITFFLLLFSCAASAQSGITWNMAMDVSGNAYGNMHPRVTMDRSGNPMLVWGRMSDESVFFSKWNGTSFSTPVKLNPEGLTIATASWMGPDIASHGDTVYVVVNQTPEMSDQNHIYIMNSYNAGASFSEPVRVDFIADSLSRFPTVTTDDEGNPIVAFMKFNSSFLDSRWVIAKSNDFGNTFATDIKASGWGGSNDVCDCCPGAIVSNGNSSAMLYRDNNSNIRDTWAGISNDNAASFSSGFNADNHNWMLMSCPSSGPDGVIIGDTLYSVFMNGSGSYRNYLSKSSISNSTNNSVSDLTGTITGLSQQNYPRISNSGNEAAIVWRQTVSGVSQLPILFTNDINNGFPATFDTVDVGNITNTDVALSDGKIFVVWQDDNSGTIKYRSGNYTPLFTNTKVISESTFTIYPNPASEFIAIQFDNADVNRELAVINVLGEVVFTQNSASSTVNVNASSLPAGIYFLQVKSDNHIFTQKFVKK